MQVQINRNTNTSSQFGFSKSFCLFLGTMLCLWILIQMIILFKNYQIYKLYEEPFNWSTLLIPRGLSFFIGLFFIGAVWKVSHHFIQHKYSFLKSTILHLMLAFFLSFVMNIIIVVILQQLEIGIPSVSILKLYFMELDRSIMIYLVFASLVYGYEYINEYKQSTRKLNNVLESKNQVHAGALAKEIDPHLLSNYLSGINSLIDSTPALAGKMVRALAHWNRSHIDRDNIWITLSNELHFTEEYLELEKIRFGEQLHINMDIELESNSCLIPKKIIQPIVENAIKHSQSKGCLEGIDVSISTKILNDQLQIRVENNGCLTKNYRIQKYRKIGLSNILKRLDLLIPNNYEFRLFELKESGKVVCELIIPAQMAEIALTA